MSSGYVIFAPDYKPYSAGVKCLYILCDLLNKRGYPSFIVGSSLTDPSLRAPLISYWEARVKTRDAGFVMVYPETIKGNPMGAEKVVRWVLNRPGYLGGDPVFDSRELVFNYSDIYLDYIQNKVVGRLCMPTIDESIFFTDPSQQEGVRSLECFYVGKSSFKEGFFDPSRAFEITRTQPPKKELGKLFRGSKVLYCFDNSTILAYEAVLCGCPVVVIPDGTQKRTDYEKVELGMNGIAWGIEELPKAKQTIHLLPKVYEQAKADFQRQLDHFVELTQAHKEPISHHCETCKVLQRELDTIQETQISPAYKMLDEVMNTKYHIVRRNIEDNFPRFHDFICKLGGFLFYTLKVFKQIFFKGREQ